MGEVAHRLASEHGATVLDLLGRRASREQKGLNFEERLANIRGSILLKPRKASIPKELLLIDDVFTTGATVSECARLLRSGGARRVEVLTLAID
jgi:predicted amidophosphoribosyltransferase